LKYENTQEEPLSQKEAAELLTQHEIAEIALIAEVTKDLVFVYPQYRRGRWQTSPCVRETDVQCESSATVSQ